MKTKLIIIVLLLSASLYAEDPRYVTISTLQAAPMALGGAYTAWRDGLPALAYNPAAFMPSPGVLSARFSISLNPFAPLIVAKSPGMRNDWRFYTASLFQGMSLSLGRVAVGLVLYNESLVPEERLIRPQVFSGKGLFQRGSTIVGMSLALAPRVAIGASAEYLTKETENGTSWGVGYRYGLSIMMKHSLDVGICFMNFPPGFKDEHLVMERFADETLNIGVRYAPVTFLCLAADIRNVSDEDKAAVREPHLGLELLPLQKLKLRLGYTRYRGGENYISLGAGLFDGQRAGPGSPDGIMEHLRLDGAILWKGKIGADDRWIFLTGSIVI